MRERTAVVGTGGGGILTITARTGEPPCATMTSAIRKNIQRNSRPVLDQTGKENVKIDELTIIPLSLISEVKVAPHLTRRILIEKLNLPQRPIIVHPFLAR